MLRILRPEEDEKRAINKILVDMCEYYSIKLSERVLEMYVDDLLDVGSDDVLRAAREYRQDWNSKTFPLPAQLRKQIFFSPTTKVAYA